MPEVLKFRVPKLTLFCYQQQLMKPATKCKSLLILIAGQQRKSLLTAKLFCNGSVLMDGVSENIYFTKFEWLGNSFLSIGKYKQRYIGQRRSYESHASVPLYVRSISPIHHIIVQCIYSKKIFHQTQSPNGVQGMRSHNDENKKLDTD